jgi:hypothetical protein
MSMPSTILIHCWYSRHWDTSYHTRQRIGAAADFACAAQGLPILHHARVAQ